MNTNRSRTQKRSSGNIVDMSGNAFATHLRTTTNNFVSFLNEEANNAFKRPWHKLEKGLRMNRLRKFSEDEGTRLSLSEAEKTTLLSLLLKAFNKNALNSKSAVIYDPEEESIKEIKGLVMHRNADGRVLFQILEKRNAVTFRKKNTQTAQSAQGQTQQSNQDENQPKQ
jgi:hypothetical protein